VLRASADQSWKQSNVVWARVNECTQQALKVVPGDATAMPPTLATLAVPALFTPPL
jgi:hypothetical protein